NDVAQPWRCTCAVHKDSAGRVLHEESSTPIWFGQGYDTRQRNRDVAGCLIGCQRQDRGCTRKNFVRAGLNCPASGKRYQENQDPSLSCLSVSRGSRAESCLRQNNNAYFLWRQRHTESVA